MNARCKPATLWLHICHCKSQAMETQDSQWSVDSDKR